MAEILARSLEQEPNEQGRPEYFYIVRWDGYGPEDDTWEPRSNVMVGSSRLVQEFDAKRECLSYRSPTLWPRYMLLVLSGCRTRGHGEASYFGATANVSTPR